MSSSPTPSSTGPRIALLPEVVRNQIAAGEVIERPASVVKELVENAVDAGATRVTVDLEEGGAKLVRVTDDGGGMSAGDLELAFVAHATSKLATVDDLEHIASLGFRGEALASMGAVARCAIESRPADAPLGARITCEGGRLVPVLEAGAPRGTKIEVRDLFYNTPARRRFLKRTQTELARCLDVLQRLALAHEGVGFVVTHDGRRVLDVEPEMTARERVRRLFGAELADELVAVSREAHGIRLAGLVAPPRFARRDTARQMWFLNGRPLRDKVLVRILREAYRGYLADRQPVAFLALSMDPARVDVNVHPAKSEVRFRDERPLFGFAVEVLREAVRSTDMATPGESMLASRARREAFERGQGVLPDPGARARSVTERGPLEVVEVPGRPFDPERARARSSELADAAERPGERALDAPSADAAGASELRDADDASNIRDADGASTIRDAAADAGRYTERDGTVAAPARDDFRGPFLQVGKTYLLRAVPEGFEIVDQHALHERVTFELLRREVSAGRVEVQRLLVPELVELSAAETELLAEHAESLARVGIELAPFGPRTVAVSGLPARLRRPDALGLVRDVAEILARTGRSPDVEDVIEDVLHRAACRSSVMAGDELTDDAIRALLARAAELESDQTCPHGRPTRVRFTLADLEKAFHRR